MKSLMKVFLSEIFLKENVQLAVKQFVDTGKISEDDFEEFLSYITIKQKAYLYFQLFFLLKEVDENRLDQHAINLFKELNKYYGDKNRLLRVEALEQNSLKGNEFDQVLYGPVGLINALEKRRKVLDNYSKMPSKYRRNINKLINNDYSFYKLTFLVGQLREINALFEMYKDYPNSENKEKILNTAFSSKFNSLANILGFLTDSYAEDLHFLLQKNIGELINFIKEEVLNDDIKILYKNEGTEEIVLQVFDHDVLRKLTCNTKWCFSRSGSIRDWYEYAQGNWVILVYDFEAEFPESILAILPNFDVYDGNNIKLGDDDEEYGKYILSQYLSKQKIRNL